MDKIQIQSNEEQIAVTVFKPASFNPAAKLPAMIVGRGWTSVQETGYDMAQNFADQLGIITVTFDYSGLGQSSGSSKDRTIRGHLDDLLSVFDYVSGIDAVDELRIIIHGISYSAYQGILACQQRKIFALIMQAPALYPDEVFDKKYQQVAKDHYREFRQSVRRSDENMAFHQMQTYDGDLLIIERGKDEVIPQNVINCYVANAKNCRSISHQVLPGAAHHMADDPSSAKQATKIVIDWIEDKIL